MKLIIFLTATSLVSNGPRVEHPGASGVSYSYLWSEKHRRHILEGRELGPEDLDRVAHDVFAVEGAFRKAVPKIVPGDEEEPATTVPPTADTVTVDSIFERSAELSTADRRKLGGRLLNATRAPRAKPARTS